MNTHMEREPTAHLARNMEVLSQCGVKWIRGWWGWGMCEKERGKFDWTEYDRQLKTVEGADMRLMPILLRYYAQYEQAWAGSVAQGTIQRPPYKMEEWSAFVRKVVERYKGRVTAWELWNEPTMSGAGFTPEMYADLAHATAAPMREVDPKAKIIGFAGVELPFIKKHAGPGHVADHGRGERALLRPDRAAGDQSSQADEGPARDPGRHGGDKPIWHTEQGVRGDDDGYLPPSQSEAEVASLYTRNMVTLAVAGHRQVLLVLGANQPDLRLGHLLRELHSAAAAGGAECLRLVPGGGRSTGDPFSPGKNAYAHLFQGTKAVVRGLEHELAGAT